MGAGEWLDEFWGVDVEGMVALLVGWMEGICAVRLLMDFGPALTYKLSSSLNSSTQYTALNKWIALTVI